MAGHLVAAVVNSGFSAFEFGCAVEIFGLKRPELGVEWYEFEVCAAVKGRIRSNSGLDVEVRHGLELLDRADTIVIPCWPITATPPGELIHALTKAHRRGARLLSICTGSFLLAEAGLLEGRRATTHWIYADEFAARFPNVRLDPNVLYVDDGDIVTAAGTAAGLDMLLHVVRRDYGARVCNDVARRLVVPAHRDGGQAQFIKRPVAVSPDQKLNQVVEYLRHNVNKPHRTTDLASMAAMSNRSFFRKFKEFAGMAPYDWLIRERVTLAKDLLEDGALSVDQVADAAGFGSSETFRHHFRKLVGRTPSEYRLMFPATDSPLPKLLPIATSPKGKPRAVPTLRAARRA